MGRGAESLSVFVVQRHFRQVRRGYDPAEVDRHLDVISQWLSGSRVATGVREGEARLAQLEQEVAEAELRARQVVEGAEHEAQATLEGARLRAGADTVAGERARADAEATAARGREEAEALVAAPRRSAR